MNIQEFSDKFNAMLDIQLSKDVEEISPHLYNAKAPEGAEIVSMAIKPGVFEEGKDIGIRPITEEEYNEVVITEEYIRVESHGYTFRYRAPNGKVFTVRGLFDVLLKIEKYSRPKTDWFGGIDVHHIFFEGFYFKNGVYHCYWGS